MTDLSGSFKEVFLGKMPFASTDEIKCQIGQNTQIYESDVENISETIFNEWSENMLHQTNTILFGSVVNYFSCFTKVLDIIPSLFPQDSQIFLTIVQIFMAHIAKNDVLMENICNSICHEIQDLILEDEPNLSDLTSIITILKSFHLVEKLHQELIKYSFDYQRKIDFSKDNEKIVNYVLCSFKRYMAVANVFKVVFIIKPEKNEQNDKNENLIHFLNNSFKQLIVSKVGQITDGVRPAIGELLNTPFLSWISHEYCLLGLDLAPIYESCANFVYDSILMFTRGENDQIGKLLKRIEEMYSNYAAAFESVAGAINMIESNIRSALNDERMKFCYNLAAYLDSMFETAIVSAISNQTSKKFILSEFVQLDECQCQCAHQAETVLQSIFIKTILRIENLSLFCEFFRNSLISLTATYGADAQNVVQPILNLIQLATCRSLSFISPTSSSGHNCNHNHSSKCNHNHDHNSCNVSHNHGNCSHGNVMVMTKQQEIEMNTDYSQVEASLEFGGKIVCIHCDYMTMKIIDCIIESGNSSLEDICKKVKGKETDIENRLITLSDYLLIYDDEKYSFDGSFEAEGDMLRIPPFFEEMKGHFNKEKEELIKRKALSSIITKISEPKNAFLYDASLMIKRRVRPDTAMLLDILDDFVADGLVTLNEDIVSLVENESKKDE